MRSESWVVRVKAANDPDLPPHLVERLAEDEEWSVRRTIAQRSDIPPELVEQFAGDQDSDMHTPQGPQPEPVPTQQASVGIYLDLA